METIDLIAALVGANLYLIGRVLTGFKGDKPVFRFLKFGGILILLFSLIKIAFGYFAGG
jgi:hypothetical protein